MMNRGEIRLDVDTQTASVIYVSSLHDDEVIYTQDSKLCANGISTTRPLSNDKNEVMHTPVEKIPD